MSAHQLRVLLVVLVLTVAMMTGCGEDGDTTATDTVDAASTDALGADTSLDTAVDSASQDDTPSGDTAADMLVDASDDEVVATAGQSQFPWSSESTDEACANEIDDNDNGYTDCDDFACSRSVAVFVCGSEAHYEASPDKCANDGDDDGDGLEDCADPDCAKNPFHEVCPAPQVELVCGDGVDDDSDGHTDCDDGDCKIMDDACAEGVVGRVLFDLSLDETSAGGPNSDWVVDPYGRLPFPSNPTGNDQWSGALSSFGYELFGLGYTVENLVPWESSVTYGDGSNVQDLSRYDVLVLTEPSAQIPREAKNAIISFVLEGGGLLMVANHLGADRDGNGWSAPQVLNDMLQDNDVATDPFGILFDEIDLDTGAPLSNVVDATHPVMDGPHGPVGIIGFFDGCTAYLTGTNDGAVGLMIGDGSDPTKGLAVGAAVAGQGKVVFVTDSAIMGDGSDSHGNVASYKDAWHESSRDNAALFLNAVEWLASDD